MRFRGFRQEEVGRGFALRLAPAACCTGRLEGGGALGGCADVGFERFCQALGGRVFGLGFSD